MNWVLGSFIWIVYLSDCGRFVSTRTQSRSVRRRRNHVRWAWSSAAPPCSRPFTYFPGGGRPAGGGLPTQTLNPDPKTHTERETTRSSWGTISGGAGGKRMTFDLQRGPRAQLGCTAIIRHETIKCHWLNNAARTLMSAWWNVSLLTCHVRPAISSYSPFPSLRILDTEPQTFPSFLPRPPPRSHPPLSVGCGVWGGGAGLRCSTPRPMGRKGVWSAGQWARGPLRGGGRGGSVVHSGVGVWTIHSWLHAARAVPPTPPIHTRAHARTPQSWVSHVAVTVKRTSSTPSTNQTFGNGDNRCPGIISWILNKRFKFQILFQEMVRRDLLECWWTKLFLKFDVSLIK